MTNYPELNILSAEQIWGDENSSPLQIFVKRKTICPVTDFAYITGCEASYDDTQLLGWSYTNTVCNLWENVSVDAGGEKAVCYRKRHDGAVRPCFVSEEIFEHFSSLDTGDGVFEVSCGEYPQSAADAVTAIHLSDALKNNSLVRTGKVYTFCGNTYKEKQNHKFIEKLDLVNQKIEVDELQGKMEEGMTFQSYGELLRHGGGNLVEEFRPEECEEYYYNGRKFIYIKSRPKSMGKKFTLSNGMIYTPGDMIWIEVEPVVWYVDAVTKTIVSEKGLISGIRLQKQVATLEFNFEDTDLGEFLKNYMASDIFNISEVNAEASADLAQGASKNAYGFDFSEVSEEEIIRGCIQGGIPVFLHGASSEGKSARVKQIDPDCVVVYMRNATPDSLNGKSVVNQETGEMTDLKPTWLKKLEAVCASDPENPHVLFFDELTNALPSIQGSAFNIVLDHEVNGIWKLPENARIVAAGNELGDSLAAYQIAEPLFNRFAHVYIKTSLDAWLIWAANNNIHPSIYAYIACNEGAPLRSEYNGQLPNADPRKWEMASKVLYAAGKPEMIRCLVGEEITADFCKFCKKHLITPDDVLSGNLPDISGLTTEEIHDSVICLSQVDAEHLAQVRSFVKTLGAQYCVVFDTTWAHNDFSRLEKIAALKRAESENG